MKPGHKLLTAAVVLLLCGQGIYAATLTGKVVGVSDGDTITVLDDQKVQHKIRLAGIDAPEKKQAFGQVSKDHLAKQVFSKFVTVDYSKSDKYGRLVGKILLDGQDVNIRQLQTGLAWHYKKYEAEQPPEDRVTYARAEQVAQDRRVGLWGDRNPVAPWDFRHK
jgi:endonuclease YncB( thermonuclease family)